MSAARNDVPNAMDGAHAPFPETRWSIVLGGVGAGRAAALEALARAYWRPVYGYARARRLLDHEDALDATQEFFLWMVSSGFLGRADPARGRFRAFVKVALDRFLVDLHRAASSVKRGCAASILSLDSDVAVGLEPADLDGRSPEDVLDDLWRRELISRALERLERRLTAEGRAKHFALFKDHYVDGLDGGTRSYDVLAARHGVSRVDVSNWLMRTKGWFRDEVRKAVLETVGDANDLGSELRWLFGEDTERES
jgi:RNA polymerase sigma factor (sigma-70 family)